MIERHESASAFLERVGARLMEDETRYHLILSLARRYDEHPESTPAGSYFVTMEDDYDVMSAAVMTPPHGLVATALGEKATRALVDDLAGRAVPTIHAPTPTAEAFARSWSGRTKRPCAVHRSMRSFALDTVADVRRASGALRQGRVEELGTLVPWYQKFFEEVREPVQVDFEAAIRRHVQAGGVWVWEDGGRLVSMAVASATTPRGVRIGGVYTPKEHRAHGYATSCVAALSATILQQGKRWCFLYTDATNPTSNAIYERIGYRFVADFSEWRLDAA